MFAVPEDDEEDVQDAEEKKAEGQMAPDTAVNSRDAEFEKWDRRR